MSREGGKRVECEGDEEVWVEVRHTEQTSWGSEGGAEHCSELCVSEENKTYYLRDLKFAVFI